MLTKKQNKNIFMHMQTISDDRGRYLIVTGELNLTLVTLINVCGSKFDNLIFFHSLFNTTSSLPNPYHTGSSVLFSIFKHPQDQCDVHIIKHSFTHTISKN